MINLKDINITFDRDIICNSEIEIPDQGITVLTGESGSGKTTLLYMLGMISSNTQYVYYLDNEIVDFSSQEVVKKLQREKFGFLFQDSLLIDSLTVGENIRLLAKLGGEDIRQKDIIQLLKAVELTEDVIDLYPKKLSGGEQQRVSLAAVIAKNPKYILVDEPTSSLDKTNASKIINVLKLLSEKGCSVVIATHNQDICMVADKIYHLENKKINLVKEFGGKKEVEWTAEKGQGLKFRDLFQYAKNIRRKRKGINVLLTIFCAIAMTGFAVANNIVSYMSDVQKDLLNQISDREIFLVNQISSTSEGVRDFDGNPVIDAEDYDRIKNMQGVDKVYSIIELRSFAFDNSRVLKNKITVITDELSYDVDYALNSKNTPSSYIVLPYFSEQKFDKQLVRSFADKTGIYISYELADTLRLMETETETVELEYKVGVPVKKYVDTVNFNGEMQKSSFDITEFVSMNIKVEGILNSNVVNRYTINGNRVIYVPYEMLSEWVYGVLNAHSEDDYADYSDYELQEWGPSACIVYTDSYKNISVVQGKLENISPNFTTRYEFQDAETIDIVIQNIRLISRVVVIILLFVISALMFAVFMDKMLSRKKEYAFLKANGMTGVSLNLLTLIESILEGLKVIIVSVICSVAISIMLSRILMNEIRFVSVQSSIYIIIFSLLFITIPSILSIIYVNHIKEDKILRN